jgi:hypothetical protein
MLVALSEKHPTLIDRAAILALKSDIEEDRATLESLMARLGVDPSRTRKAAGWFAEKLTNLKLAIDDRADGAFRAFEMLELVSLGIEGKMHLWRSLSAVAPDDPVLSGVDYPRLMERAGEQRAALAPFHASAARAALTEWKA